MPLDRNKLERAGRPSIRRLIDGRRQITRRWKLSGDAAEAASIETEAFLPLGTADFEFKDAVLSQEPVISPATRDGVEMILTEVYEEASTPTNETEFNDAEVDEPRISTDANGRRTVTRQFIVKNDTSDALKFGTVGTLKDPDSSRFPNHYLHSQQVNESEVLTRISRTFVQVTESPVQVGDDDVATGQDNRSTLRRRFFVLRSATYTPPTVGVETVSVAGKTFVYAGERRSGDSTIRRITRRYVEATDTPVQVGKDDITRDADGRRTLRRQFVQRAGAGYTPPSPGEVTASIYAFTSEQEAVDETVRRISRTYLEAGTEAVQVGNPNYSRGPDDRKQITRTLIKLSSASEPSDLQGQIGVKELEGCVLSQISAQQNAAVMRIQESYLEATNTSVEIGKPDIRQIPRTKSPAMGLTAAGARQWTHRFLVMAGSGDISSDHWLDYNAAGPLGTHQKLINQQIGHRGKGFAIINRVFVEVPGEWTESRRMRYMFPGSYFLSGSGGSPDPSLKVEPVRRWVTAHITETYSTTEPTPSNEVFEVFRWLSTRLELPGHPPRLQTYRGYLGSVAWTGDYEESGSSDPSSYPAGMTVIESDVRLWQGRIWRRRDVSIDFGGE